MCEKHFCVCVCVFVFVCFCANKKQEQKFDYVSQEITFDHTEYIIWQLPTNVLILLHFILDFQSQIYAFTNPFYSLSFLINSLCDNINHRNSIKNRIFSTLFIVFIMIFLYILKKKHKKLHFSLRGIKVHTTRELVLY